MRKTIVALMLVAFVAFALVPAFAGAKAPACPKKATAKTTVVTKTVARVGTAPAKKVGTLKACTPVKKAVTVKSTKVKCATAKKVMSTKTTTSTTKKPAAKPGLK